MIDPIVTAPSVSAAVWIGSLVAAILLARDRKRREVNPVPVTLSPETNRGAC